jgi:hypothetical protein
MEEVDRQQGVGLGAQERPPGFVASRWRRDAAGT